MSAVLDIEVPRNGDYFEEWRLSDNEGAAIDLTGHTLAMVARATGGDPVVIASAILTVVEPTDGRLIVRWHGPDFFLFGSAFALTRAAYDLKDTFPDGVVQVPVRGHLLITPEVTF